MSVLIVGGGIGGLAANALLRQRGFETKIIDRAKDWNRPGHAVCLWMNGQHVLDRLGILAAARARSHLITSYGIANAQGKLIKKMDLGGLEERRGPLIQLQRGALHELLRGLPENRALQMNRSIRSFRQTLHHIEVVFSDGSKGTYDALVGADGIRSQVRSLVFPSAAQARSFGAMGWAFVVPGIGDQLNRLGSPSVVEIAQHGILEFWQNDRYFGIYPLSDDRFGVYCAIGSTSTSLRLAQNERAGLPKHKYLDLLRTAFRSFSSMVQLLLTHLPSENEVFFDFLEEVRLPRWTRGRAALLGDAAHSMLPFGGMGASMAMEDALVVTDELAQVGTAEAALAFERYNRRRRKRVTPVQLNAHLKGLAMLRKNRIPLAVRALQGVCRDPLRSLGRFSTLQERMLDRLLATAP